MRFDDMVALHAGVRAGLGVGFLPCFLGDSDADLVRLPGVAPAPYLDIWVVTHPSLRRVPRVRSFMAFVAEAIRAREALFMGESLSAAP
ncbi:MAG: LysR substrate-binding domain-containing protein, partial [Thermohalobaculum sp.]|nr:LysR substrate-binding domain-containing protein [Thermohalobaculum sp.]